MSIEITPDNIGDVLRDLANENGVTQNTLAEKTGITRQTINRLFTNKGYSPSIKVVHDLAKVLDKKVVLK